MTQTCPLCRAEFGTNAEHGCIACDAFNYAVKRFRAKFAEAALKHGRKVSPQLKAAMTEAAAEIVDEVLRSKPPDIAMSCRRLIKCPKLPPFMVRVVDGQLGLRFNRGVPARLRSYILSFVAREYQGRSFELPSDPEEHSVLDDISESIRQELMRLVREGQLWLNEWPGHEGEWSFDPS